MGHYHPNTEFQEFREFAKRKRPNILQNRAFLTTHQWYLSCKVQVGGCSRRHKTVPVAEASTIPDLVFSTADTEQAVVALSRGATFTRQSAILLSGSIRCLLSKFANS